jgi:hypothetical protein
MGAAMLENSATYQVRNILISIRSVPVTVPKVNFVRITRIRIRIDDTTRIRIRIDDT